MATISPPLQNSASENEPPELEKVKKWQQARQAKMLQGEYESAVVHLSELINNNLETPLVVSGVRVKGANTTRDTFLHSLINPLLPNPSGSTVSSVLSSARAISSRLLDTDIFSSLSVSIDPAKSPLAAAGDVDIVLTAKEKGRFFLKSSTEVGNNEGNASVTGRIRNVFGGAEVLEGNVSLGTTTKRAFYASLSAPLVFLSPDLRTNGELNIYGTQSDLTAWASCVCAVRGVRASIRRLNHQFSYETAIRNIGELTPNASLSVRQSSGPSIKSSLSHIYTLSSNLSSSATFHGRLIHEFAGLGGDASYLKHQSDGRIECQLGRGFSFSLGARTGLILPSRQGSVPYPDRFQLGGPLSVRSFRTNGMGPRDGADSLGGTLFYAAGLSLLSPIPRKPHWPVKIHSWVNAGVLSDPFSDGRTLTMEKLKTLAPPSLTAGVGFVYDLPIAAASPMSLLGSQPERPVRLELNFGLPLAMAKNESARKGIQVGIGVEFL